jgi:hypothetical protein
MKRFYKLLGITALVAVIAIGLVGCPNGTDSVERDPALFGTWVEPWEAMTFNSDGSFKFAGPIGLPPNATWSTSNGVIYLDYPGRTVPQNASYIISNSGHTLTTTNCNSGYLGNSNSADGPAVYTKQ